MNRLLCKYSYIAARENHVVNALLAGTTSSSWQLIVSPVLKQKNWNATRSESDNLNIHVWTRIPPTT